MTNRIESAVEQAKIDARKSGRTLYVQQAPSGKVYISETEKEHLTQQVKITKTGQTRHFSRSIGRYVSVPVE